MNRNHDDAEGLRAKRLAPFFTGLLDLLDPESNREGLLETPTRAAKAWAFWTSGYAVNADALLKVFDDGAENVDEMVVVHSIPFHSHCEHHMAAIFGTVTVGYIPDGKIVGLSKINRVVDAFARRLQVQERMTTQIADCIQRNLKPLGVGVWVSARHMCVESRGIRHQGCYTVTTALRGVIKSDAMARAEFLGACK